MAKKYHGVSRFPYFTRYFSGGVIWAPAVFHWFVFGPTYGRLRISPEKSSPFGPRDASEKTHLHQSCQGFRIGVDFGWALFAILSVATRLMKRLCLVISRFIGHFNFFLCLRDLLSLNGPMFRATTECATSFKNSADLKDPRPTIWI